METAIRKATRLDYNPPKQKHLSTLTSLTFQSPGNAATIIDLLDKRLRENSWIIIFKVLITIHTLMRLGDGEKTISYVETKPSALDTSRLREKSSGVVHIQNIYLYTAYLEQKVIAYRHLKYDYVKNTMGNKEGRLRHLSVKDGLLKETVVLQKQIGTLLKCNFILDDVDNNISLYAYKLLVEDLLVLFQVINESIVNILEHYFAMEKPDARTSLEIYKRFAKQTQDTVSFFDRARKLQHELQISVPSVKHAPLSLAAALQEYLDDASKDEAKKSQSTPNQPNTTAFQPTNSANQQQQQPKELLDFFTSLENEKTNIFYNPVVQQQPQQMFPSDINQQQQMFSPVGPQSQQMFSPGMNQTQQMFSPVVTQPTGHNPFRSAETNNAMILPPNIPQPSTSSILPQQQTNTANPFRSNTMPTMSASTPTMPFFNNSNPGMNNFSTLGNMNMMQQQPALQQQQQQQTSLNISMTPMQHNPFAMNSQPSQIMVASPTAPTNSNPFNNTAVKHQQLQPWGSSLF